MRTLKRRRRESKTDYKLRMGLLKSEKARIVIRRSNNYMTVQAIESIEAQDKVIKGVTSKDLLSNGWDAKFKGSLKSVPAAYLTGLLLAKKLDTKDFILDLGMTKNIAGNRTYAVVKGLIDGGLNINANEKVFPSEDRLKGLHMNEEVQKVITKVKANLN